MARIAMLHIGLGGHLRPAARLGAVLAAQGHDVSGWGPADYREQIEVEGVQFVEHEPLNAGKPFGSLVEFSARLAEAADACLEELIEELFAREIELVIHDVHVPWGRIAADFLGLPRIVSNPLFPGTDPARPVMNRDLTERAEKPRDAPSLPKGDREWQRSRVETVRVSIARRWGVELGEWNGAMSSTGASISYTSPLITGPIEAPGDWCFAGPLLPPAPPPTRPPGRPLVYAAFGTYYNAVPQVFRLTIEALRDEPVEVVISTGRSKITPKDLEPLPDNMKAYEFVPSREVLAQASAHVTHGGCSSVHESLLAGVPMVCLPLGSDQASWAARVADLGAGEVVRMWPADVRRSVHRMLATGEQAGRARELGEDLLRYDGPSRVAAFVARELAGSSA